MSDKYKYDPKLSEHTNKFIKALWDLASRESDICPHCGAQITALRQVRRSVYASPCNCRVYQGTVPDAWK